MINPHFANLPRVTSPVSATVNAGQMSQGINALADFGGIGQPGQPPGGRFPGTTPPGFTPRLTSGTAYGANQGAGGQNQAVNQSPPRFTFNQPPAVAAPQPLAPPRRMPQQSMPVPGTGMVQQRAQQAQSAPPQQAQPILNPGTFLAPQPGQPGLTPTQQPTGLLPPTGLEQQPLQVPQQEPVFNFGPAVITDDMFQQPDQNQYNLGQDMDQNLYAELPLTAYMDNQFDWSQVDWGGGFDPGPGVELNPNTLAELYASYDPAQRAQLPGYYEGIDPQSLWSLYQASRA